MILAIVIGVPLLGVYLKGTGQLVGILRNRLGLGGHSERARSDDFRPEELPPPE